MAYFFRGYVSFRSVIDSLFSCFCSVGTSWKLPVRIPIDILERSLNQKRTDLKILKGGRTCFFYYQVVVSNMFYFHLYLGKISNLTNIFQMGSNHQPVFFAAKNGSPLFFHIPPEVSFQLRTPNNRNQIHQNGGRKRLEYLSRVHYLIIYIHACVYIYIYIIFTGP